ncbi:MAG: DnaJ domain-containing protein [Succinivibrio sp.]|nr:DnaJ domain-containing protein [Succinivibrio sp.]MDD6067903.1 DnaJ domain-containing protein [Succinivibrio sp.]MDD7287595.1 DnaJ domain-containing protein [Succinivibrio sp.]MDY5324030.1 DnaJ domain-containing protein [Succinivibrio sp.]MDY5904113.1 DnaJ domain-containing protein [Succinivibrio sp.]
MAEQNTDTNQQLKVKQGFIGTLVASAIGAIIFAITGKAILLPIFAIAGFVFYDRPNYIKRKEQERFRILEIEQEALAKEQEKELKAAQKKLKAAQKKNRGNRASLYENIYTVAGYALALQQDLNPYIKKAEDVIKYFKASVVERRIAVEAFNRALDPSFDVDTFVKNYIDNIGRNRDYISYVLTYAYLIACNEDLINPTAKDRLFNLALLLGSSKAALGRLFKTGCAQAKFAQEYDEYFKSGDSSTVKTFADEKYNDRTSSKEAEAEYQKQQQQQQEQQRTQKVNDEDKTNQALEILGLSSKATMDEVKKAYKKLMFKYHPDRLAASGLPEDMIAIYTEKSKAIQVAYDHIKKIYADAM